MELAVVQLVVLEVSLPLGGEVRVLVEVFRNRGSGLEEELERVGRVGKRVVGFPRKRVLLVGLFE